MIPGKIFSSAKVTLMDQYRRLSFELPYGFGNCIFGWYAKTHMHMIRHGMAFYKFYSKLSAKISENLPNLSSKPSKYRLFTVFGYEHNMVKAIPCHVGLFIPVSHMAHPRIPRWDSGIEPFLWSDYNSGSAEPFRVTPPEAVV